MIADLVNRFKYDQYENCGPFDLENED